MTFLNASLAAAGLACVSIPIIIHLLMNRRRKPVLWGAMRFLLEAYKRQRRRLILEKWLLLAARCLLVALLALALGKPLLGALVGARGGHTVFILIDNSLASQARLNSDAAALDRHKQSAKAIIGALRDRGARFGGEPDRVGLITLAGPAEGAVMPPTTDLGALASIIDDIQAQDSRGDVPGGLALVGSAFAPALGAGSDVPSAGRAIDPGRALVVVLSDFLEGSLDPSAGGDAPATARLPDGVTLMASEPAAVAAANVTITGVEPLRSVIVGAGDSRGGGEGEQVRVFLSRSGAGLDQAQTTSVRAALRAIDAEGLPPSAPATGDRSVVHWAPGQDSAMAVASVRVDQGVGRTMRAALGLSPAVIVATTDSDAIPGDNRWLRPVDVRPMLRVGVAAATQFGRAERADRLDPGAWARLALTPAGEGGDIEAVGIEPAALDGGRLIGLDALILPRPDAVPEAAWTRIRAFVDSGGMVLVTPPPGVTVHLWADAMTTGLGVPWTLARESREVPGLGLRGRPADGAHDDPAGRGPGLFSMIEGELNDLLSPVTVHRILPMTGAFEGGETALSLEDGTPLLWAGSPERLAAPDVSVNPRRSGGSGRGLVAYLAVALDLEWSDMPAKPLMVPLVQELVRQGVGQARGRWWSVAGSVAAAPGRTMELMRVSAFDPPRDRVAADSMHVDATGVSTNPIRASSVWKALDPGGAVRGVVAVNADARGGRAGTQTREAVGAWLRGIHAGSGGNTSTITWLSGEGLSATSPGAPRPSEAIASAFGGPAHGSPIWFPLLVGASLMALAELVIARWASHASVAGGAGIAALGAGFEERA